MSSTEILAHELEAVRTGRGVHACGVCVCVCVCARARACVCALMCALVRACQRVFYSRSALSPS